MPRNENWGRQATDGGQWMQIPLAEFERLHEEIKQLRVERDRYMIELTHRVGWEERALDAEAAVQTLTVQAYRHEARVAELENELLKAYSERDAAVTELRGIQWGLSNAEAEEHDIREP